MALFVVGVFFAVRRFFGPAPTMGIKCETCSHCRKLFRDGVMCGYEEKEVFKNPAQINMCPSHETVTRLPR